jgi:hypothetical protein
MYSRSTTQPAKAGRRHRARSRQSAALVRRFRPGETGHRQHPDRPDAGRIGQATGILIPRLKKTIVTSLTIDDSEWEEELVCQLLEQGLLKTTDKGNDFEHFIHAGFERMLGPRLRSFDSNYDRVVFEQMSDKANEFQCCVWDEAASELFAIKPIVEALVACDGPTDLRHKAELKKFKLRPELPPLHCPVAEWGVGILNNHGGIGRPAFWSELASWTSWGGSEVDDEGELGEEDNEKKSANEKWYRELVQKHPYLEGKRAKASSKLVDVLADQPAPMKPAEAARILAKREPELADILVRLEASADRPDGVNGVEPFMGTVWEHGDAICHMWDIINHEIHSGNLEAPSDPMIEICGTIPEMKPLFAAADAWLQPIHDLFLWKPRHEHKL